MVIEPAQSDNDVLARSAVRQLAFQHDLNRARNLPPEFARGPHRGCIRANDRRSDRAQRAIHIGVRIRCHHKRTRHHITALHHDLVTNARPRRIEIHALLFCKGFNGAILLQVRFIPILDVVIECESKLLRIFHLLRADALELTHHRRRVVVRHAAMRTNREEIPRPKRPRRSFGHVFLRDLFNDGLTHIRPLLALPEAAWLCGDGYAPSIAGRRPATTQTPISAFPLQLEPQIHHLPNVMMEMRRA